MNDLEVDGFLFSGPLWFIAPKPPYRSLGELCAVILTGLFRDRSTADMVPIVYVFSDRDLAERFLEKGGPASGPHSAVTLANNTELIEFLVELQSYGHQHLGIDVEQSGAGLLPIARAVECLRRRRPTNGNDTDPDSVSTN